MALRLTDVLAPQHGFDTLRCDRKLHYRAWPLKRVVDCRRDGCADGRDATLAGALESIGIEGTGGILTQHRFDGRNFTGCRHQVVGKCHR